jgi:DNA-binding transcriptional MocR family regulator
VNGLFRRLGVAPRTLPRTRPLYRRLVTLIESGIARGDVPGEFQLPAERDLASVLRVSRTTVVSAYRELEARGLVRGYVGRGTFVLARPDAASAPFAWRGKISSAALQARDTTVRDLVRWAADPKILSLGAGEPALDCFPADAFRHAADEVMRRQDLTMWRHVPTEGVPRLRAALATRFGGEPEHILVIAGAQQGLDLVARCLVDPGDAVIIDRPGYLGAIQTFRAAGARLVGWDITRGDVEELDELCLRYRPKLIYTNPTHHNPTGVTLPIRVRRDMLSVARRYRVPIVEDDTYRELALSSAHAPPSLFDLDEGHEVVIRINTFSKMLAPGLRLGWISAVRAIVEELALIKQSADPCTHNFGQLVACELVERGVLDRHLIAIRAEHRRRRDALARALSERVPAGHLTFQPPEGGMYLWCRLRSGVRARRVQEHAIRESVSVISGEPFYVDQGGASQLRLCFTPQPAARAPRAADALARSIAAAEREPPARPAARVV